MNTSEPESKVGLLDIEINKMAKVGLVPIYGIRKANKRSYVPSKQTLCAVTFLLSLLLVALNGFRSQWYIYVFRFLILFSTIIPIR